MPILLTTPFNPGDNDKEAAKGYPHCQLVSLVHNPLTMGVQLSYEFGFSSGPFYEVWKKGAGSPTVVLEVSGPEVMGMWSRPPQEGETVGEAMRRLTYAYLIESGKAPGTVVNTPPLPPEGEKPTPQTDE